MSALDLLCVETSDQDLEITCITGKRSKTANGISCLVDISRVYRILATSTKWLNRVMKKWWKKRG
jgi:hypothetical protein